MEISPHSIDMLKRFVLAFSTLSVAFDAVASENSFYDFVAKDTKGNDVALDRFRGMISLIVNVASQCGYTDSHYKDLVKLQKLLGRKGFIVLAFPCNQFGQQEPDTSEQIETWAMQNYKVNFPIFQKIDVLDGDAADVYKFLIEKSKVAPNWNFWKYLVDHDGKVLEAYSPTTAAIDVAKDIKRAIKKKDDTLMRREL